MFACAAPAHADTLIRDAELEDTLRHFADPIFTVAGLTPDAVHLFIVDEDVFNSYVAGGQNIFLYTGMLLACENPNMLLGVIAHETGHIAGGHLARGGEELRNAPLGAIFGFVLGAAAAVVNPAAGVAVMAGGQNLIERKVLTYSRGHEQAADQAALRFLGALQVSASGMIETFEVLRRHELRTFGSPDPYLLTHPLSADRISYVRDHVDTSSIPYGQHPGALDLPLARLRAKLYAFTHIPPKVFARYPASELSLPARMARAIAWFRLPDFERANKEMNALLKDYPNDPFLYDLDGQILFESGHGKEALAAYRRAADLKPDSALILTSLGQAQLSLHAAREAAQSLEKATTLDTTNAQTWHLLATAYGALGDTGRASLALAEEAALEDKPQEALQQANHVLKAMPPGSPASLRAEDIKRVAEDLKRKQKEAR